MFHAAKIEEPTVKMEDPIPPPLSAVSFEEFALKIVPTFNETELQRAVEALSKEKSEISRNIAEIFLLLNREELLKVETIQPLKDEKTRLESLQSELDKKLSLLRTLKLWFQFGANARVEDSIEHAHKVAANAAPKAAHKVTPKRAAKAAGHAASDYDLDGHRHKKVLEIVVGVLENSMYKPASKDDITVIEALIKRSDVVTLGEVWSVTDHEGQFMPRLFGTEKNWNSQIADIVGEINDDLAAAGFKYTFYMRSYISKIYTGFKPPLS